MLGMVFAYLTSGRASRQYTSAADKGEHMMTGSQEVFKRLLWGCIGALLLAYAADANTLTKLRVVDSNHSVKIILSASEPSLYKIAPDLEQNLVVIHLDGISVTPDFSMPRITGPLIQDIKISSSSSTAPGEETADGLKVEVLFKPSDVSFRHEALDKPAGLLLLVRPGKSSTKTGDTVSRQEPVKSPRDQEPTQRPLN
jgi:hypothetical protein